MTICINYQSLFSKKKKKKKKGGGGGGGGEGGGGANYFELSCVEIFTPAC